MHGPAVRNQPTKEEDITEVIDAVGFDGMSRLQVVWGAKQEGWRGSRSDPDRVAEAAPASSPSGEVGGRQRRRVPGAVRLSVVLSWTTARLGPYRGVKCRASAAAWWFITRRMLAFIVYTLITAVSSSRPGSPYRARTALNVSSLT